MNGTEKYDSNAHRSFLTLLKSHLFRCAIASNRTHQVLHTKITLKNDRGTLSRPVAVSDVAFLPKKK
jgi:hypothetical protein